MSVRTAIELKKALDAAAKILTSMGCCYDAEREFKSEYLYQNSSDDDEEFSDDETKNVTLGDISSTIQTINEKAKEFEKSFSCGRLSEEINKESKITFQLPNFSFDGSIKEFHEQKEQIFQHANIAAFGDLKTLETKVDPTIRAARDIKEFTLSDSLTQQVQKLWNEHFGYRDCKAVPYKINLYQKGSGFAEHRDTPDKDLVGTFLVSLGNSSNSELQVKDYQNNKNQWWEGPGRWCAFYPDCPHQVPSLKYGTRATLAFKIYSQESVKTENKLNLLPIQLLKEQCQKEFKNGKMGLLLAHDYTVSEQNFRGVDHIWLEICKKLELKTETVNILHHFSADWGEGEGECCSKIFLLSDNNIDFLLGKSKKEDTITEHLNFFQPADNGFVWLKKHQSYIDYVGNECQPGNENSIYLNKALIIQF